MGRVQERMTFTLIPVCWTVTVSLKEGRRGPPACCSNTNQWALRTSSSSAWRQQTTRKWPHYGWLQCTRRPNFCTKLGTSDVKTGPAGSTHPSVFYPVSPGGGSIVGYRRWAGIVWIFINASSDSAYPSDPVSSSVLDTSSYHGNFCKKEMFIEKKKKKNFITSITSTLYIMFTTTTVGWLL